MTSLILQLLYYDYRPYTEVKWWKGQVTPLPDESVKCHYYLPEQQQLLILQSLLKHNIQPEATAQHTAYVNLLTSQDAAPISQATCRSLQQFSVLHDIRHNNHSAVLLLLQLMFLNLNSCHVQVCPRQVNSLRKEFYVYLQNRVLCRHIVILAFFLNIAICN